mgnify:FL=1
MQAENQPEVRKVIALLCSDIHLSHRPPVVREEKTTNAWYSLQSQYLSQLSALAGEYNCPIVCAGDIFDRWNSPAELINFALAYLPDNMYCIPGQHDLLYHDFNQIVRSAYWTLVEAGKINHLSHDRPLKVSDSLTLHGVPWGHRVPENTEEHKEGMIHLAAIHAYIWTTGHNYPGASQQAHIREWARLLSSYDAAVFGDNHKGFLSKTSFDIPILNCGTLMRRKSDELAYIPCVGLLWDDGIISQKMLDTSVDKFIEPAAMKALQESGQDGQLSDFLQELSSIAAGPIGFADALKHFLSENTIGKHTRQVLREIMGDAG